MRKWLAITFIVACGLVALRHAGARQADDESIFKRLVRQLESGKMARGATYNVAENKDKPLIQCGYHDKDGFWNGVYVVEEGTESLAIYLKRDVVYAACRMGPPATMTWYFCDCDLFQEFIALQQAARKRQAAREQASPAKKDAHK